MFKSPIGATRLLIIRYSEGFERDFTYSYTSIPKKGRRLRYNPNRIAESRKDDGVCRRHRERNSTLGKDFHDGAEKLISSMILPPCRTLKARVRLPFCPP